MPLTDPRFHVLTTAEIAAKPTVFRSDDFVYNRTTKELRLGPGTWASCTVLLEPGGGGGASTSDDVSNESTVSGSTVTAALNALLANNTVSSYLYLHCGEAAGRGIWVDTGVEGQVAGMNVFALLGGDPDDDIITAVAALDVFQEWRFLIGGVLMYTSTDNVADPSLITTWVAVGGATPLPTTSVLYSGTLEEVLRTMGESVGIPLQAANNLSDLASPAIARVNLGIDKVTTFSNANATATAADKVLAQIGTLSASRTVTLPAANSVNAGYELVVADVSGTVTSANTIVVQRAGSDTINGATSVTIGGAYGWRRLVSDGTSKWSFDGGILRSSNNLSDLGSVATARTNLGVQPIIALVTESTTARTLALTDADKLISCTNSGATTITIAPQASVVWLADTEIQVMQKGTGQVTVVGGSGVTVRTSRSAATYAQYSTLGLKRIASDEWLVYGDTE